MSSDRTSIPVSLSQERVEELDELVAAGHFESRSDALRYGARLVTRQSTMDGVHDSSVEGAQSDIDQRLERKRARDDDTEKSSTGHHLAEFAGSWSDETAEGARGAVEDRDE